VSTHAPHTVHRALSIRFVPESIAFSAQASSQLRHPMHRSSRNPISGRRCEDSGF
jgi:hypothetical protein